MDVETLARAKHLPENWLREVAGVRDLPGGGVAIPYWDQDASELFERARDVPGRRGFNQPAGVPTRPYGLWKLAERDGSTELFVCEGESDTWALWHIGLLALGIPGANNTRCLHAEHLAGWAEEDRLYLCPDNDDAGRQFTQGMQARLGELGFPGHVYLVRLPPGVKDASDFRCRDVATFRERWRRLVEMAEPVLVRRPAARPARANGRNGTHQANSRPAPEESKPPPEPVLVRLSDVKAEAVRWLWPGWMPYGTLVVLDGDPGLGKSTLTLDLTARVTTGRAMPPLNDLDLGRKPAGVLLLGAEDSLSHTVRPRLDAAGADASRVYSLEAIRSGDDDRPVVLPRDLELAAGRMRELEVKLVVVDPLMAYLASDTDAHKDQDIRRCLKPLAKLAGELDLVVLLVRHLNKLSGGPALYRGGSSIGITGASRASLIVGRDPNADRFVLAMNKCNLGPRPTSLAYRLESAGMGCRLAWDGEVDLRPDEILGHGPRKERGRPSDPLDEAINFLADLLSGGAVATADVEAAADKALISWRTVARAKSSLGVRSVKRGTVWYWELPGKEGRMPKIECQGDSGILDPNSGILDPDESQSASESDDPPWD